MERDGAKLFPFWMRLVLNIWLKIGLIRWSISKERAKSKERNIFAKKSLRLSKSKLLMQRIERRWNNLRIESLKISHKWLRKRKKLEVRSDKWAQNTKENFLVMSKYPAKDIHKKMSKTVLLRFLQFQLLLYHLSTSSLCSIGLHVHTIYRTHIMDSILQFNMDILNSMAYFNHTIGCEIFLIFYFNIFSNSCYYLFQILLFFNSKFIEKKHSKLI